MRRNRYLVIAASVAVLASTGGQALAVDGGARSDPAGSGFRLSHARMAAIESAAMSAAMLAARSPRQAYRQLLGAELAAIDPGAPPVADALQGLQSDCEVDESGGFASGSSGPSPAVAAGDAAPTAATSHVLLSELLPAGDLNGKGRSDVLDYRLGFAHGGFSAGVTARSGRTGAALWSRVVNGAKDSFAVPFPDVDRVGRQNQPGVLLVKQTVQFALSGPATVSVTVRAISGAGVSLWTTTTSGQLTQSGNTETLTNAPIVVGDVHDAGRPGHDLLLDVINGTENADGSGTLTDQPEVMSATNGSLSARGAPVASTVSLPEVVPVPSLTGGHLDDLAVIRPGSRSRIVAERSDNGQRIWASTGVPVGADDQVTPAGDLSGARSEDLIVTRDDGDGDAGPSTVSLLNGATGRLLWTVPASCGYEIDKAGPKLAPAVGLINHLGATIRARSLTVRLVASARDRAGNIVLHRTLRASVKVAKQAHSGAYSMNVGPFGDVQPDGAQDLLVALTASLGKHIGRVHGVLSGRDGNLIREPAGLPSAGSLQRGRGVDMVKLAPHGAGIELSAYDGASGKRFYTQPLGRTTGLRAQLAYGVRVSGHSCSDLVVSAGSKTRELIGMFDANARPLWTVTASSAGLIGGHVHEAKRPVHFCVA